MISCGSAADGAGPFGSLFGDWGGFVGDGEGSRADQCQSAFASNAVGGSRALLMLPCSVSLVQCRLCSVTSAVSLAAAAWQYAQQERSCSKRATCALYIKV